MNCSWNAPFSPSWIWQSISGETERDKYNTETETPITLRSCVADLTLIKHTVYRHTACTHLCVLEWKWKRKKRKGCLCVKMMHTVCVRCTLEVYRALIALKSLVNGCRFCLRGLWGVNWSVVQWDFLSRMAKDFPPHSSCSKNIYRIYFVSVNVLKIQSTSVPVHCIFSNPFYFLLSLSGCTVCV